MNNSFFRSVLTVVLIIALAWFGYSSWKSSQPDKSARKMILLADGQVYFGYASSLRNKIVTVTDIYYVRAQQPLQGADNKSTSTSQEVEVVKLGEEFYGPKDKMLINRDRITFTEEVKDDSQVSKAITDYLNKQK